VALGESPEDEDYRQAIEENQVKRMMTMVARRW